MDLYDVTTRRTKPANQRKKTENLHVLIILAQEIIIKYFPTTIYDSTT